MPLKYFCVVVDGDIDQDEAECDVDDDENDGSDDQHLHFDFFPVHNLKKLTFSLKKKLTFS